MLLAAFGHMSLFASAQNGFFCFFNAAACQSSAPPAPPIAAQNQPLPLLTLAQVFLAQNSSEASLGVLTLGQGSGTNWNPKTTRRDWIGQAVKVGLLQCEQTGALLPRVIIQGSNN